MKWLAFLDAASSGDTDHARAALQELELVDPRWRQAIEALAGLPEMPALGEILAE